MTRSTQHQRFALPGDHVLFPRWYVPTIAAAVFIEFSYVMHFNMFSGAAHFTRVRTDPFLKLGVICPCWA
jgi:hypothetical protein